MRAGVLFVVVAVAACCATAAASAPAKRSVEIPRPLAQAADDFFHAWGSTTTKVAIHVVVKAATDRERLDVAKFSRALEDAFWSADNWEHAMAASACGVIDYELDAKAVQPKTAATWDRKVMATSIWLTGTSPHWAALLYKSDVKRFVNTARLAGYNPRTAAWYFRACKG